MKLGSIAMLNLEKVLYERGIYVFVLRVFQKENNRRKYRVKNLRYF